MLMVLEVGKSKIMALVCVQHLVRAWCCPLVGASYAETEQESWPSCLFSYKANNAIMGTSPSCFYLILTTMQRLHPPVPSTWELVD